jgi:hypothetical protein
MAKLSDVQFSLSGEQKNTEALSLGEQEIVTELRQERGVRYHIFKLLANTRKGGVHVPGIDDVINPATGKMERIRLLSGVDTIWVKEQKDITPEYVRNNMRSLSFVRGTKILRIPEWDTTALEFARITRHNVGSSSNKTGSHFEFYEYDPAREQEEMFRRESMELEMAILAKEMPAEKMRKHAAFLGIRLIDDLGLPKTDDGLRREYMVYAKRNPDYFQKTKDSKEIDIMWMIKRGILDSKIEIGREPGKIYWSNGGGLIGVMSKQDTPEKYLLNLALTNTQEGEAFRDQLKKIS